MRDGWLCVDKNSQELEDYLAEVRADALTEVALALDELGIAADDPRRAKELARVAAIVEREFHAAIAKARRSAAADTARSPSVH